jgi:hypothetical protein
LKYALFRVAQFDRNGGSLSPEYAFQFLPSIQCRWSGDTDGGFIDICFRAMTEWEEEQLELKIKNYELRAFAIRQTVIPIER